MDVGEPVARHVDQRRQERRRGCEDDALLRRRHRLEAPRQRRVGQLQYTGLHDQLRLLLCRGRRRRCAILQVFAGVCHGADETQEY